MDMWIDVIRGNTAAVFCCGVTFIANTNTNPSGLSKLVNALRITCGGLTVHIRKEEEGEYCTFTFEGDRHYSVFSRGNILSWLVRTATSNTKGTWNVPTDCTQILPSALWLYTPKPTITRFQNPNIRYSYIIVNSDTSVLVFNEKERKVDTYTPNTIQGILLTGLHLKTYLETAYNDTHSE